MSGPEKFRAQARDCAAQAAATNDLHEAVRLKEMAKSYLLLAKNAHWISSTDEFIGALKSGRRLSGPPAPHRDS